MSVVDKEFGQVDSKPSMYGVEAVEQARRTEQRFSDLKAPVHA